MNTFFCELFLEHKNHYFSNYANDTTPCVIAGNTTEAVTSLTDITQKLFTCFANSQMKANPHKCHLLLDMQDKANNQIKNVTIESSSAKKILGMTVDNKLGFDKQYEMLIKK